MQNFKRQNECQYPFIERLRQDFGLQLSQQPDADNTHYCLVVEDQGGCRQLTPALASVSELEAYAAEHMTDILHDYLCSTGTEVL